MFISHKNGLKKKKDMWTKWLYKSNPANNILSRQKNGFLYIFFFSNEIQICNTNEAIFINCVITIINIKHSLRHHIDMKIKTCKFSHLCTTLMCTLVWCLMHIIILFDIKINQNFLIVTCLNIFKTTNNKYVYEWRKIFKSLHVLQLLSVIKIYAEKIINWSIFYFLNVLSILTVFFCHVIFEIKGWFDTKLIYYFFVMHQ